MSELRYSEVIFYIVEPQDFPDIITFKNVYTILLKWKFLKSKSYTWEQIAACHLN